MRQNNEIIIPKGLDLALATLGNDNMPIRYNFDELHQLVDRTAAYLIKNFNKHDIIATQIDISHHSVIVMLAIWRANMTYMPIRRDGQTIEENQAYIEKQMKTANAVTLIDKLPETQLDGALEIPSLTSTESNAVAYIISSSGTSNGETKLIYITFESLMDRIFDHQRIMKISKANNDCMLGLLDYAWDASIMETLSALTAGIPLVVVPREQRESITRSLEFLFKNPQIPKITTGIFIPSLLAYYEPKQLPSLAKILSTGEAFDNINIVQSWLDEGVELYNGWGPTETTFGCSIVPITKSNPKGYPIFYLGSENSAESCLFSGLSVLRLARDSNEHLWRLALIDEECHLFVTGKGIGRYNFKDNSAFIPQSQYSTIFEQKVIDEYKLEEAHYPVVYNTKDIACVNNDEVIFLRRSDHIIKREGKQVSLSKIEADLKKHFNNAIVVAQNNLIHAFIYSEAQDTLKAELLMGANRYYRLNKNDLFGTNKKIIRKLSDLQKVSTRITLTATINRMSETQKKVHKIWSCILDSTGSEGDTFEIPLACHFTSELGASSLMFMEMSTSVWESLVKHKTQDYPTSEFNRYIRHHQTIAAIADLIDQCNQDQFTLHSNETYPYFERIEDLPVETELQKVSLLMEMHYKQPVGPYIVVSEHDFTNESMIHFVKDKNYLEECKKKMVWNVLMDKLERSMHDALKLVPDQGIQYRQLSGNCLLLGDSMSGKTSHLLSLLQKKWGTNEVIPIYFSLRGKSHHAIIEWLTNDAGLNQLEISRLHKVKTLFLLDDYELINRYDLPSIENPFQNSSIMIACRARYQNNFKMDGFNTEYLYRQPGFDLKNFLSHEQKRLANRSLRIDLQKLNLLSPKLKSPYNLHSHHSRWETLPPAIYLNSTEKEMLSDDGYFSYDNTSAQSQDNSSELMIQGSLSLISKEEIDAVLVTVRQGFVQQKPIFCFSPITGDVPDYYRKLSDQLGHHQPFYVIKLSENMSDRTSNLQQRAQYYGEVVQYIYPKGNILLMGWSFGALISFTVANYLKSKGRVVELIVNIDSDWPKSTPTFEVEDKLSEMRDKLDVLYKNVTNEKKQLIWDNTRINLAAYKEYFSNSELIISLKNTHIDIPMLIFRASNDDTGMSKLPEFAWPNHPIEVIKVPNSTHFTVFESSIFIERLKKVIKENQPRVDMRSLEDRLDQHRLSLLGRVKRMADFQILKVLNNKNNKVNSFESLVENDELTILCGEPGSGKSTIFNELEYMLLSRNEYAQVIPLKLSNITFQDILYGLGYTPQEIDQEQRSKYWFLLDGLDEATDYESTIDLARKLSLYGKILISVRTYTFNEIIHHNPVAFGQHQRFDVQPLTDQQIQDYLKNDKDYAFVKDNSHIYELAKNPLSLSLIKKIISHIPKSKAFNRGTLYQTFFDQFYIERKMILEEECGIHPDVNILAAFENYNRAMSLSQWELESFHQTDDVDTVQASRCDLTVQHQTFSEYFIANTLFDEIKTSKYLYFEHIDFTQKLSMLDFLVDKIQALLEAEYLHICHKLHMAMYCSNGRLTSNIATLLNRMEVPFSGLSLFDKNLSTALLAQGVFDRFIANEANFSQTNFTNACIQNSSFHHCDLMDSNFGAYADIEFDGDVEVFSPVVYQSRPSLIFVKDHKVHRLSLDTQISVTLLSAPDQYPINQLVKLSGDNIAFLVDEKIVFINQKAIYMSEEDHPIQEIRQGIDASSLEFYTDHSIFTFQISNDSLKEKNQLLKIDPPVSQFRYSSDYSKVAYINEDNHKFSKFSVMCVNTREIIFDHNHEENIQQISFYKNTDYLCTLNGKITFTIFDSHTHQVLNTINLSNTTVGFTISNELDIVGFMHYTYPMWFDNDDDNDEADFSRLSMHTISTLGQPSHKKRLVNIKAKLHPNKPCLLKIRDANTLEIQSLITKEVVDQVRTTFKIKHFSCYQNFIYILGKNQLLIVPTEKTKNNKTILFSDLFWESDYFDPIGFSFYDEKHFAIFNSEQLAYIKGSSVFVLSTIKNINWVNIIDSNQLDIGHSQNISRSHYADVDGEMDYYEYVENTLLASRWHPLTSESAELLFNIKASPSDFDESPLYGFLERHDGIDYLIGGGNRQIYACTQEHQRSLSKLPGYDFLKIRPNLYACTSGDCIAFYQIYPEMRKIVEFHSTARKSDPFLDQHGVYFSFEWCDSLSLLKVSDQQTFSLWHIDISNDSIKPTLLYDSCHKLNLVNIDYQHCKLNVNNQKLLSSYTQPVNSEFQLSRISYLYLTYRIWSAISPKLSRDVTENIMSRLNSTEQAAFFAAGCNLRTRISDIPLLKPLLIAYFKQFMVNQYSNTNEVIDSLTIDQLPRNKNPYQLYCSFFFHGKAQTYSIPPKIVINPKFFLL